MDREAEVASHGKPPSMYQCGICKREYRRLDHLSRHSRSHTQSRPHKCHICSKSFTRTDLLKRHLAAHERHSARAGQDTQVSSREDRAPLGRVALACKACSSNHLRCSDQKPCSRCVNKGVECVWDAALDVELVYTPPMTECEMNLGDEVQELEDSLPMASQATETSATTQETQAQPLEEDIGGEKEDEASATPLCFQESSITQNEGIVVDPALLATPFPFRDGLPSISLLSAPWSDFGDEFGLDAGLLHDIEDVQFSLLSDNYDAMPFQASFGGESGREEVRQGRQGIAVREGRAEQAVMTPSETTTTGGSSDPGQPAAMCTEAFRNSHWHYRPEAKDFAGADNHNLSLTHGSGVDSPESRIIVSLGPAPHRSPLGAATRDKILTMVVKNADLARHPEAAVHFPSMQLLDSLLRMYLQSPISRAGSFIHMPTFVPGSQRPELLAAMIAHGAVLTANTTLAKVGFAIAEIARLSITRLWDGDNSLVRDLQLSQAFFIILELGLWSGHGRHVEIAECFLHPLVTMMRRAGKFTAAAYGQPSVEASLGPSDNTHDQWLAWIEVESFKRLAFRLLQHDANASMALLVNPVISYAEVQLPIPDSATLWSATTAEQWRTLLPSRTNHQLVTAGDLVDDPDILNRHAETLDRDIGSRAVLSLGWMLTWEYTRMSSFQKRQSRQFNALITKLRLEELRKLLGTLTIGLISAAPSDVSPVLAPKLDLLHLHLHMPLEDIQIFAGMQGAHQARAVYPSVRDWVRCESARRAVYHAAQIIRASRHHLPDASIQGPEAILVYYASLALWVYGLLVEKHAATSSRGQNEVYLDTPEESIALQRFIELGVGRPCIQRNHRDGHAELRTETCAVYLDCPDAILKVIIHVVRCNFWNMDMAHLTQKLIQLMEQLTRAATQFAKDADI